MNFTAPKIGLFLIFCSMSSVVARAQETAAPKTITLTTEQQAAALGFVALNNPDLMPVLNHLRNTNRPEYDKGLAQIYMANERLGKMSKDDAERHDVELRMWIVNSRLTLLAARMSVSNAPTMNDELKQLVREEVEVKSDLLNLDYKRDLAKLEKLKNEITRLKVGRDKEVDTRVAELKKEISRTKQKPIDKIAPPSPGEKKNK